MRLRHALLAATMLAALSSPALAQSSSQSRGFYVGGALGGNFLSDAGVSGTGVNRTDEYKKAALGALQFGYAYGNGLRTEIELAMRSNNVDKVTGTGAGNGAGSIGATSGMLNLLYDINLGSALTPYIGVGAGVARVKGDGARSTVAGTGALEGSDTDIAYQGIVGVAYDLTSQLKLALDYRYFATLHDPDLDLKFANGAKTAVSTEYQAHSVMLGLRYHFGAPAAPAPVVQAAAPAPAPAPAPAAKVDIQRSFLVFFDFDKSDVTAEAGRVIAQAADHAKKGGIARVIVTGHTDTSGAPAYNQRLSERRAANVREALVRQGLAANAISTAGKGESDPLVKTGDGVREAQNRRAEIVLQ